MKVLVTCPPMLGMIDHFQPLFGQHGWQVTAPKVVQTLSVEELIDLVLQHDGWIIGDDPATFQRTVRQRSITIFTSVARMQIDQSIDIAPQDRETFHAGLRLFRARPDKGYSLTDCISMECMSKRKLTDVLTNDEHFSQEGFVCLLRHCPGAHQ